MCVFKLNLHLSRRCVGLARTLDTLNPPRPTGGFPRQIIILIVKSIRRCHASTALYSQVYGTIFSFSVSPGSRPDSQTPTQTCCTSKAKTLELFCNAAFLYVYFSPSAFALESSEAPEVQKKQIIDKAFSSQWTQLLIYTFVCMCSSLSLQFLLRMEIWSVSESRPWAGASDTTFSFIPIREINLLWCVEPHLGLQMSVLGCFRVHSQDNSWGTFFICKFI